MHAPVHSRLFSPAVAPNRPAAHGSGAEAPREQAKPGGHSSQPASEVREVEPEKNPMGHGIAAAAPFGQ
eukprot:3229114-Prymnesium_polylepis.1